MLSRLRTLVAMLGSSCRMPAGLAAMAIVLLTVPSTSAEATAPPAVANLRVTAAGFDTMSLAWDRPPGADFYRVLVDGVWRSGVYDPTTADTVTQLKVGVAYTFEVQARGVEGDFGPGSRVRASTLPDEEPPSTPTDLRQARDASGKSIGLTWTESTDNWGVEPGYKIFANGSHVFFGGPPTTWVYLTDPYHGGLNCGQAYSFTVQAIDKNSNRSGISAPVTAIPPC